MGTHVIAGYRICIEPILKDVTTLSDDPDIDIKPATKSVSSKVWDEKEAIELVKKFFSA